MVEGAKFCTQCGQKAFDGRIRLKELLSNMMINVIHLDGKFIRMCWMLFIPGKVSTDYFEGKIIRYPNPVQFFFISAFFFVLLCSKFTSKKLDVNIKFDEGPQDTTVRFSGTNLLDAGKFYIEYKNLRKVYQALPDSLRPPESARILDTVLARRSHIFLKVFNSDSIHFGLGDRNVDITVEDMIYTDADLLPEKYKLEKWHHKALLRQGVRSMRDIKGMQGAIIGSITWSLLSFVTLMSGLLWLLLRKRRGYYVEHFVFLMHYLSAVLMVFSVLMASAYWLSFDYDKVVGLAFLGALVFLFFAMRRFYGTSTRRTLLYWVLVVFAAVMFGVLLTIGGILLSLLFV
jgi:hypothetical protein